MMRMFRIGHTVRRDYTVVKQNYPDTLSEVEHGFWRVESDQTY